MRLFVGRWKDAIGSEFGSRHTQYGMFCSGTMVVTTGMAWRKFDWDWATELVDRCMAGYDPPEPPDASGPVWDRKGST